MRTRAIAVAAALAVTALAAQDKAELRLRLTDGQTIKFKSVTKTRSDSMGFVGGNTITMTQHHAVSKGQDGWTALRITNHEVKVEGDGMMGMEPMVQKGITAAAVNVEVDHRGRTRNIKLENVESVEPMVLAMYVATLKSEQVAGYMGVRFPEDPVEVGSKWATDLSAAQMFEVGGVIKSASGNLPIGYEVLAFETLGGKRTAKVASVMKGSVSLTIDAGTGLMDGTTAFDAKMTLWVEIETGLLAKATGTADVRTRLELGEITEKVEVTVERVQ